MTLDDILEQVRPRLGLEAEAEHEVLEEIRGHLEEAAAAARARGLDDEQALREAAAAFGVEQSATELRQTHAGWGTLDGVAVAALPVIFTLIVRWLIFAPEGSAGAWRQVLPWPTLAVIAGVIMLVPLLRLPRRRIALALWALFMGLSLITAVWPTLRW